MSIVTNPRSPSEAVGEMAARAAGRADAAIDHARRTVNDHLDTLQAGVQVAPSKLTRAATQVEALTRRSLDRARDTSQQLRMQARLAGDRSVDYIRNDPVRSVLIAAAVGAVAAMLASWAARSRRDRI
jgi:ElaB/YqjD/DUF883 family membrane-anchored ribosome-binding protein